METSKRRNAIMKLLCRRRHETIENLAIEFDVSERTIRRDIEFLSLYEPIYTQTGRYGGGVYVTENYRIDRMYFQKRESDVLTKLLTCAEHKRPCLLSSEELSIFKKLITDYTKPNNMK